jgi:hypothetical protein
MEIQISMINCQKQLEELEYDRVVLAARIAVHKATLLANAKKRGVEDSNKENQKISLIHREERKRGEEKFSNGKVQFQLKDHQNELEISIATDKAYSSIHRNKIGIDNSIRDTHIRRGDQFAAIGGNEEDILANEGGGKKARFEASSDMDGGEDEQESFVAYQQLLESQRKQKVPDEVREVDTVLQLHKVLKSHDRKKIKQRMKRIDIFFSYSNVVFMFFIMFMML